MSRTFWQGIPWIGPSLTLAVGLLAAPPAAAASSSAAAPRSTATRPADSVTDFAFALQPRLGPADQNLAWSPAGLGQALAMLYAGAGGVTKQEMSQVLGLSPDRAAALAAWRQVLTGLAARGASARGVDTEPFRLSLASALWPDARLKLRPEFAATLRTQFDSELITLAYDRDPAGAVQRINNWVNEATRGRIAALVEREDIQLDTRLLLTTAVYLNAAWRIPFDEVDANETFTGLAGQRIEIAMMNLRADALRSARGKGWSAVALPYDDERLEFVLVVPDADFARFEAGWNRKLYAAIADSLRARDTLVRMPQFDLAQQLELIPALKAAGLGHLFQAADFSGMAEGPGLEVAGVRQKAKLTVGREGTVAAAATAVFMRELSAMIPGHIREPLVINADRPFLFVLRDRPTGAILFMGRVVDPSASVS